MSTPVGHPDWDASVTWRSMPLFEQFSGNYPASGMVVYSGAITNWPSLQIRCIPSTGGIHFAIRWFADAALTKSIGSDDFFATSTNFIYELYETQGPFVDIQIVNITTGPTAAGLLIVTPVRAPALGHRPLVTPQAIGENNVTIPAGTTNLYYMKFNCIGMSWINITAISPSASCEYAIEETDHTGAVQLTHQALSAIVVVANQMINLTGLPVRLTIKNTTTAAATFTLTFITQQQGW